MQDETENLLIREDEISYGSYSAASCSSPSLNSLLSHSTTQNSPSLFAPTRRLEKATNRNDDTLIRTALETVGEKAFGIIAIDVWLLQQGRFVHEMLWVDSVFANRHPSEALEKIMDPSHRAFAVPVPQVPGAGLAGYFWSLNQNDIPDTRLTWRDLNAITTDPFQPPYRRMRVLEEAGFGKATGVPFSIGNHRGVVVYLARAKADESALNESAEYLWMSSQYIGSASALRRPRHDAQRAKEQRMKRISRRIHTKVSSLSAFRSLHRSISLRSLNRGLSDDDVFLSWRSSSERKKKVDAIEAETKPRDCVARIRLFLADHIRKVPTSLVQRLETLLEKSTRATDLKPPPPVPLENALFTFVGAFLTLLSLLALSTILSHSTGTGIVLAPFGALLTLQFSLTAAPASQPRNVIFGQLLSLTFAVLGKQYLGDILPSSLLVALVAALAISVMTKLGIPHPPAAAAVIALYAEPGGFTILMAVFIFLGNLLAVFMAILVNNLSEKRQYPVYWELGFSFARSRGRKQKAQPFSTPKSFKDMESATTIASSSASYPETAWIPVAEANDEKEDVPVFF